MSTRARADSDSPRRVATAVRRLVGDSERSAASALAAVRAEVEEGQRELGTRERQLADARRAFAEARSALARCRAQPGANCGGLERAVAKAESDVRRHETRARVAREVLADLRRQHDHLTAAHRRLITAQQQSADGALRTLAAVSAQLDAYLAGAPAAAAGGSGDATTAARPGDTGGVAPNRFSSAAAAESWELGLQTRAGRAYYEADDRVMRELAAKLKPFAGEYTVDVHGSPTRVAVGDRHLDAHELAELVRADPEWEGRPVRLFSCNTGQGLGSIGEDLSHELDVRVTAPSEMAWSDHSGASWVASIEMRQVGGSLQRVPGPPLLDGWKTFNP